MFSKSAKEIKNVKVMVLCGLLVALAVAIEILNPLNGSASLKVSFSFIFLALIGYFSGPVTGMYVAVVFDILNFLFSKDGTMFVPLYTLLEVAGGFIYGVVLYKDAPMWNKNIFIDTVLKCAVTKTLINLLINICGNSILNIYLYNVAKDGVVAYMIPRVVKNIALLPAEIIVLVVILTFIRKEKQFSVWLKK